nr:reverse transcriptase domain-containing protein [Tanacetum cinerariifolium]
MTVKEVINEFDKLRMRCDVVEEEEYIVAWFLGVFKHEMADIIKRGEKQPIKQPYQATAQSNQNFHLNELEKIKRMNDVSLKAMQNQIDMMNTASTSASGTLPGNTIANPKGELKAITTRSGLVTDGPTIPNPPKSVNPEEDGCAEETYTDPDHAEYTIKVPPSPVQKPKPLIQRNFILNTRDSLPPHIPDPRVPLILGRPFLRTTRALIDIHGEEMILRDGDERLTLNMKHDTASYSNHPHRESVNLINIFNIPIKDCLEDLVSNKQSGNPTFSLHKEITSPEVTHEIHDSKGCTFLSEELLDIDSFNDIHPHFDDDPLSGNTTYSANSLLEEFADELALITYHPDYDDNQIESDDTCDDSFDSEGEKINEAELLIDQLDLPCDILSEYDTFNSQDVS